MLFQGLFPSKDQGVLPWKEQVRDSDQVVLPLEVHRRGASFRDGNARPGHPQWLHHAAARCQQGGQVWGAAATQGLRCDKAWEDHLVPGPCPRLQPVLFPQDSALLSRGKPHKDAACSHHRTSSSREVSDTDIQQHSTLHTQCL